MARLMFVALKLSTKLLPNSTQIFAHQFQNSTNFLQRITTYHSRSHLVDNFLNDFLPLCTPKRYSTIFTSVPADQLWEGVTGPKGSTKKRARGKRRVTRPSINLNRGQRLGMGKGQMEWPGLNAPLIEKNELRTIQKGEFNESYFQRLEELRNKSARKRKRMKLPPLLRGWSGARVGGQSVGPPVPEHPEFDTRVIEMKVVATMTATVGRYRRFSVLVATGNGRGLCGIGKAKSTALNAAVRRAKLRAAQNLVFYNIKEDRTLWHIGHVKEWHSTIFAKPTPEGSGLVCHRVIRTLCQIVGIKDLYAKVEGCTHNYQALARGFLRLLSEQESYDELANRIGLHVVEFSADRDMYPRVLASPDTACAVDPERLSTTVTKSNEITTELVRNDYEELPILAISHPDRHRPRKVIPKPVDSFLDDLVEIGEGAVHATDVSQLLVAGERDLDALVLGGRIPLIRPKPTPAYWNNPGNMKVAALRHRFRNIENVRRERLVYDAIDRLTS